MLKSWRTSLCGLLAAMVVIGPQLAAFFDNDPTTVCSWTTVLGAVITGVGLGAARDAKVTSEQQGLASTTT